MYRLNLFLKATDGMFLIDELWSTDKDSLNAEGQRRLALNPEYLGILTTFVASTTEPVEIVRSAP